MESLSRHFNHRDVSETMFRNFKSSKDVDSMWEKFLEMGIHRITEIENFHVELKDAEIVKFEEGTRQTKPKLTRRIASDELLSGIFPVRIPEQNSLWKSIMHVLGYDNVPFEALYALCCLVFSRKYNQIYEDLDKVKIFKYLRKNKQTKLLLVKVLADVIQRDIIIYNYSASETTLTRYLTTKDENRSPMFLSYKNGRFNLLQHNNPLLKFGFEDVLIIRPLFKQDLPGPFALPSPNQRLDEFMRLIEDTSEAGKLAANEELSNNMFLDGQRMDLVRWRSPVQMLVDEHTELREKLSYYTSFFSPLHTSGNYSTLVESIATALTGDPKYAKPLLVLYHQHLQTFLNIKIISDIDMPYKANSVGRIAMILFRRICVFTFTQSGMRCDFYTPPFVVFNTTINILNYFGKFHALRESLNPIWATNNCILCPIQVNYKGKQRDKFQDKVSIFPSHSNQVGFPPPNLTMYAFKPTSSHHVIFQTLPTELVAMEILAKMNVGYIQGTPEDKINQLKEVFIQYPGIEWSKIVSLCQTLPMAVWNKRSQSVVISPDINTIVRHGLQAQFSPEYAGDDTHSLFKSVSISMFGSTSYHYRLRLLCIYVLTQSYMDFEGISTALHIDMPAAIYNAPLMHLLQQQPSNDNQELDTLSKYLLSLLFKRNIYVLMERQFGTDFHLDIVKIGLVGDHIDMTGPPIYILSVAHRVSLLLSTGDQLCFEQIWNQEIGTISDGFGPRTHTDEIIIPEINSDLLVIEANKGLQNGEHPQFETHSKFGMITSFPLLLTFSKKYLRRSTIICNRLRTLSTGIIKLEIVEDRETMCPIDLDQRMKDDGLGGYANVKCAIKMDYMLYEGLNVDFRRLPISANTLYKYTPSGNHNQADFLDVIHTRGDDILQSDDDYYVGVSGSLIPLQLNRLLMSVIIKNYGTNSICWLIVCKNHAYKLARLLKKLTHRAKNLTECQIAYDKVIYITMHALQRNSIPYHFREHKPGETITIRSGSYYQGICTGLVVWRQKTTILADYPSLNNDWELIPSCRCHSGERSIFLDAVQAATKEFIQPRTCPCHITEPNILQTETVTQTTLSSTILQSKEKVKLVQDELEIVATNVQTGQYSNTKHNEEMPGTSGYNPLYPNLNLLVDIEHEEIIDSCVHDEVYERVQDDYFNNSDEENSETDYVEHSYDPNFNTEKGFHEWIDLLTTEQASHLMNIAPDPQDRKALWINFRQKFDRKNKKYEKPKILRKEGKKIIKETVAQKYSRLYEEMLKDGKDQVAREEEFVRGIPNSVNMEFMEIMRAAWENISRNETPKKQNRMTLRSKSRVPSDVPTVAVPRPTQTDAEAIPGPSHRATNTNTQQQKIQAVISMTTRSKSKQNQGISRDPSVSIHPIDQQTHETSKTPSSTYLNPIPHSPDRDLEPMNIEQSTEPVPVPSRRARSESVSSEHRISHQPQDKQKNKRHTTRINTRSKSLQQKPKGKAAVVESIQTRSKSKSTTMVNSSHTSERLQHPSEDESSDEEEDAADRKRRKSAHFDIGPLPIDDDAQPRADGKGQYRRIYPGKKGTYLTFNYTIDKNKKFVCRGPCCNGAKKFSLGFNYRKHVNDMTGRFSCDDCQLTFPRKDALRRHQIEKHSIMDQIYVCDRCEANFPNQRNLDRHKRLSCIPEDSNTSEISDNETSTNNEETDTD